MSRVKIIRASDGVPIPRGTEVFIYAYNGKRLLVGEDGMVDVPYGWCALNVHLRGGSAFGDRLCSQVIGPEDVGDPLVLAVDEDRDSIRLVTTPDPGALKPRPATPPPMGFERTNPPTNLTGHRLLTRAGVNTFFGVAPLLNLLGDRRVTEAELRTTVAMVDTVGGNMTRQLRNLGVQNRRQDFVHSGKDAAEYGRRMRVWLDEHRARGIYAELSFTDEPGRNDEDRRGDGYSRSDNSMDGEDRLSVSLMDRMLSRELGRYKLTGQDATLGEALVIEIGNEPWEYMSPELGGEIYDRLGKADFRNRFMSNAQSEIAAPAHGSPVFVHMSSEMPRDTRSIMGRIAFVRASAEGKPVVLDFDGARMWDRASGDDRFRGMDNYLEVIEECALHGVGVIVHLTEPYLPHRPFEEVELPALFAGKRRWRTIDAVAEAAKAWGL